MRTKSTGALAAIALLIGISGTILSGCGVGTVDPIVTPDCVPSDLDPACDDGDQNTNSIVPLAQASLELEARGD